MIGFNSNLPTVFVSPASGPGTLGKVGIGTTSPESILQIGNSTARITFSPTVNGTQGAFSTMAFNVHQDASSGHYFTKGNGTNNSGSAITLYDDGALRFYVFSNTGGSDQSIDQIHFETQSIMTLRKERVQIGQHEISSSSPFNTADTKLSVDGRIVCKDLVVSDVDWQDEVFDSTYALSPLDSVSAYISVHGHLPGFKDEKIIEANGMSISETAAVQQKTIEEMMLYILQLDARVKALEEENTELKNAQPR